MTRSKKIAATLAGLMMSAGIAFAPAASFAATQHDGHSGAKALNARQVAMYGKYRDGKNGRDGDRDGRYDRDGNHDRDGKQFRHHRYTDRMHRPAARYEHAAFERHPGFAFFSGHWVWQVNHWHWIAGSWQQHR